MNNGLIHLIYISLQHFSCMKKNKFLNHSVENEQICKYIWPIDEFKWFRKCSGFENFFQMHWMNLFSNTMNIELVRITLFFDVISNHTIPTLTMSTKLIMALTIFVRNNTRIPVRNYLTKSNQPSNNFPLTIESESKKNAGPLCNETAIYYILSNGTRSIRLIWNY